jgi:hypothetical protein
MKENLISQMMNWPVMVIALLRFLCRRTAGRIIWMAMLLSCGKCYKMISVGADGAGK